MSLGGQYVPKDHSAFIFRAMQSKTASCKEIPNDTASHHRSPESSAKSL